MNGAGVGGFSERDVICEKLREIFGQEAGGDTGKGRISGKVNFQRNDHAWTFLRKYKGRNVHSRFKAAVAHLKSSEGRSSALLQGIFGDQGTAHPSRGERHIDAWSRDGHRVWFKKQRTE